MILKRESISVPRLSGLPANQDTSKAKINYSDVTYDYICLGPELESFIPTKSGMILVRNEFPEMLKHLTNLYDQQHRGVALTGRPGIGE
jgi:hypothetical protein